MSRYVPAAVRRLVKERAGGVCEKCGRSDGKQQGNERRILEFHHVHPYVLGGEHTPENLQLLCFICHPRRPMVYARQVKRVPVQVVGVALPQPLYEESWRYALEGDVSLAELLRTVFAHLTIRQDGRLLRTAIEEIRGREEDEDTLDSERAWRDALKAAGRSEEARREGIE